MATADKKVCFPAPGRARSDMTAKPRRSLRAVRAPRNSRSPGQELFSNKLSKIAVGFLSSSGVEKPQE